jgi:hypothetical protein
LPPVPEEGEDDEVEELQPRHPHEEDKPSTGALNQEEEEEPLHFPVASDTCAACPLCGKHFRPRAGGAFDAVAKHIRSMRDVPHTTAAS